MNSTINTELFQELINITLDKYSDITEIRNSKHQPLDLLILLILNQSCSDDMADRAFNLLKQEYPEYKNILKENNPEKLANTIKICGLSNTKSKYIFNTLNFLLKNYSLDIKMPYINNFSNHEALKVLTSIQGVGAKSASCLLMFSFGRNVFPIDTHVKRIFTRLGIFTPKVNLNTAHRILQDIINKEQNEYSKTSFIVHCALIEQGRNICLARTPQCEICYSNSICNYAK